MYRILLSFMLLIASVSTVYAQSNNVRLYCAYDYMRYCSAYSLTSPNLAKCMANVGVNLSKKCINALVDDGLITKQEVIARAAKEGIVVRDGSNGLYVDTNKVPEVKAVEMPKETVTATDAPLVEDKNEVGAETRKAIQGIPGAIGSAISGIGSAVSGAGKATSSAGSSVTKGVSNTVESVKKTVKKAVTAVKTKYNKVTKSNKDYANRPDIKKQNELRRKQSDNRDIVSEGLNADFGRYEAREPGFVPPKKYNFKERMESRDIFSSGVNGY